VVNSWSCIQNQDTARGGAEWRELALAVHSVNEDILSVASARDIHKISGIREGKLHLSFATNLADFKLRAA
jgi:hypothetical protein